MSEEKSVRLNRKLRQDFKSAVIKKYLPPLQSDEAFCEEWAPRIWELYFSELVPAIEVAPEWIKELTKKVTLTVQYPNPKKPQEIKKESLNFKLPRTVECFLMEEGASRSYTWRSAVTQCPQPPRDAEICLAYGVLEQQRHDRMIKRKELMKQLDDLIDPLNTTGQLYKAWPTAREFSDCFPFVTKKRAKTEVTATEMDVGVAMAGLAVKDGVTEN